MLSVLIFIPPLLSLLSRLHTRFRAGRKIYFNSRVMKAEAFDYSLFPTLRNPDEIRSRVINNRSVVIPLVRLSANVNNADKRK
jgi:hypothetical protein